jgi:hypothetical protein
VKLLGRSTRANDLAQCSELVRDGFLYDAGARADLRRMWLELITCDTGRSAVVYEAEDPDRVLAFGVSAAVEAARFEAICTNRAPFVAKSLLDEWRSGGNPFLDEASFASANANDGLHFLVIHNGVAETLYPSLPAALSVLSESFIEQHGGCNMRALLHESFGVPRQFALDLGVTITDYAPEYEPRLPDIPKDRVPAYIISMTRDEAERRPGNLALHQIFLRFTPPRCRLRAQDRRILRYALEGTPDEEIADVLNIAAGTLKKRWAEIYTAMEPVTGITPGFGNGRRGGEIRRHVLRYVREHPEELHAHGDTASGK